MAPLTKRKTRVAEAGAVKRKSGRTSKSDVARRLASAIESHMSELGLSERQKNDRVSRFADRVNDSLARRAKS